MSLSPSPRKAGPYACDGVAVTFPFAFKVFGPEDVRVILTDAFGVETDLTYTTDYGVSLNLDQDANPGGDIATAATYAAPYLITLTSQLEPEQPVVLTNAGGFYPRVINDALDRATILIQQLQEAMGRTIKSTISSNTDPDDLIAELLTASGTAVTSAAAAVVSEDNAAASEAAAAASAAGVNLPAVAPGDDDKILAVNDAEDGFELKTLITAITPLLSDQATAETGTNNTTLLTPLRGKQQLDFNSATAATADKIAKRGTGGVLKVGTPAADDDAVTRLYASQRTGYAVGSTVTPVAVTGTWEVINTSGGEYVTLTFDTPDDEEQSDYYYVDFNATFTDNWYTLSPTVGISVLSGTLGDFVIIEDSVVAAILGVNYIDPTPGQVGLTGTFTVWKLALDRKGGNVQNLATNSVGALCVVNVPYGAGIGALAGTAKTGSALLAVSPVAITGVPVRQSYVFETASGTDTAPTILNLVATGA